MLSALVQTTELIKMIQFANNAVILTSKSMATKLIPAPFKEEATADRS